MKKSSAAKRQVAKAKNSQTSQQSQIGVGGQADKLKNKGKGKS